MSSDWDELAKALAQDPIPRRQSLRLLGAALAGAILGPLGLRTARANPPDPCRAFCDQCPRSQRPQCLADCRACRQMGGRLCGTCSAYDCCGGPEACCGDYCADLDNDHYNCGDCGHVCPDTAPCCMGGVCSQLLCPPGLTNCNCSCVDLATDMNNCGSCGDVCRGDYCANGICETY